MKAGEAQAANTFADGRRRADASFLNNIELLSLGLLIDGWQGQALREERGQVGLSVGAERSRIRIIERAD